MTRNQDSERPDFYECTFSVSASECNFPKIINSHRYVNNLKLIFTAMRKEIPIETIKLKELPLLKTLVTDLN